MEKQTKHDGKTVQMSNAAVEPLASKVDASNVRRSLHLTQLQTSRCVALSDATGDNQSPRRDVRIAYLFKAAILSSNHARSRFHLALSGESVTK